MIGLIKKYWDGNCDGLLVGYMEGSALDVGTNVGTLEGCRLGVMVGCRLGFDEG